MENGYNKWRGMKKKKIWQKNLENIFYFSKFSKSKIMEKFQICYMKNYIIKWCDAKKKKASENYR